MFSVNQTATFEKSAKKFFKKHRNLLDKFGMVSKKLRENPFDQSLKTHKLKGVLEGKYACSLNYEYRIVLIIQVVEKEVYLMDIGTHDEVY